MAALSGFFIGILFSIILFLLILLVILNAKKNSFFINYNEALIKYCESIGDASYREQVYIPKNYGIYEKKLAVALLDIALASTQSFCKNIDPIKLPPGFDNQIPLGRNFINYGHIFWNETYACITLNGTMTISEWEADFDYTLVPAFLLNNFKPGVECHKGFYTLYLSIRDKIWDWLDKNENIKIIFITGHSLGGALSTICAFDLAQYTPIHYSFAAPRSGNVLYAKNFNSLVPQSLRINNTEDIVPQLPPATWKKQTFEQTNNSIPFTKSLGSLALDHIRAYKDFMPECFVNKAPC